MCPTVDLKGDSKQGRCFHSLSGPHQVQQHSRAGRYVGSVERGVLQSLSQLDDRSVRRSGARPRVMADQLHREQIRVAVNEGLPDAEAQSGVRSALPCTACPGTLALEGALMRASRMAPSFLEKGAGVRRAFQVQKIRAVMIN